jgi:hypothetical protein
MKALKPYAHDKTYSMALIFETRNVELVKENKKIMPPTKILVENRKLRRKRGYKCFHMQQGNTSFDLAFNPKSNKLTYKDQAERWKTIMM